MVAGKLAGLAPLNNNSLRISFIGVSKDVRVQEAVAHGLRFTARERFTSLS